MEMFCRQCEQAAKGIGCTAIGVCGKTPATSDLQDLLIEMLKGIAVYGHRARVLGAKDEAVDLFLIVGLFTTVTNVNFDPAKIEAIIHQAVFVREQARDLFLSAYKKTHGKDFTEQLPEITQLTPAGNLAGLVRQGKSVDASIAFPKNEDIQSLKELLLYGLKGMAAYAHHAWLLGEKSEAVNAWFHKGLEALADEELSAGDLVGLNMEFGKINLTCMELLDKAHTDIYGHPVPTKVSLGVRKGPAILVSGHDLHDLEQLLKQTEGKGVNIYTHSEMLPAHGYPKLKKYAHLAGNYGGAWQDQAREFDAFPGAILMTTNCIQDPRPTYKDRIFTTGLVEWPGVQHIVGANGKKDFSAVIKRAIALGGFPKDEPGKDVLVGFARNTVLGVADKVIAGVKEGKIKHFFLIGGCDGAKSGRNYYTEFAEKVPKDCVILTLACGKYRFNKLEFGDIGGIPRLLDVGQCNDAYSAIQIALALAGAFKCSVNELPLSFILSWYEQKAVCILITLLSLGIKNIRLGPSLPAFVTPGVLKVLVDNFSIKPISNVDADLKAALQGK